MSRPFQIRMTTYRRKTTAVYILTVLKRPDGFDGKIDQVGNCRQSKKTYQCQI